jgi:hypothetical protein
MTFPKVVRPVRECRRATERIVLARANAALLAIHDELIDDDRGLLRLAPGVTPGRDLSGFNLHGVRESLYGALLDVTVGHLDRALRTVGEVLDLQYDEPGAPWHGTFPVLAESPPPAMGAAVWVDFDPNWRQFIGVGLALFIERAGTALDASLRARIEDALERCVDGERDRLTVEYSNPALLHAWLAGWVGGHLSNAAASAISVEWCSALCAHVAHDGDLAEYNSPTYDGIDLFALALWCGRPSSERMAASGQEILRRVTARMQTLFHPELGFIAGPYHRAYDVDLRSSVSLTGMWWAAHGASHTLPEELTASTVHVHDLYHLPLLEMALEQTGPLLECVPVLRARSHEQRFPGSVATSLVMPEGVIGWESGRRSTFAITQYAPFVLARRGARSTPPAWLAVFADGSTTSLDVTRSGASVHVSSSTSDGPAAVTIRMSSDEQLRPLLAVPSGVAMTVGPADRGGSVLILEAERSPLEFTIEIPPIFMEFFDAE